MYPEKFDILTPIFSEKMEGEKAAVHAHSGACVNRFSIRCAPMSKAIKFANNLIHIMRDIGF